MASGGGSSGRGPLSEHRKRTKAYRVDNDDISSLGSNRQEDRPNNWDCSDWKPSSAYDNGKRIKKGNNNPDREKENKKEREREHHAASQDSGSQSESVGRQHTPATFPRTKLSSKSSMSQRLDMENLRQHLSFSDVDELSMDGERNNERPLVHRERLTNYISQAAANMRNETASLASDHTRDRNSNISKSEGADSNEIVGRLMQIRDYIKQASSMMDNLKKSAEQGDQGRAKQLNQVIQRLKEQEQKYLDLLLKLSKDNEHYEKLANLVQHLGQQEKDFLKLLESQLGSNIRVFANRPTGSLPEQAAREEQLFSQNMTESAANSRQESDTEAESIDLDVRSDNSGNTTDANEDGSRRVSRPNIEDRLGRHSDTEIEDLPSARSSRSKESELDNTLVAETAGFGEDQERRLAELTTHRQRLETDVEQKNDELEALRQQHELLKKMLYQQEQLRALQGRQAALQALQRDAESNLEEERSHNEASRNAESGSSVVAAAAAAGTVALTNGVAEDVAAGQNDMDALPQELKDLRRRLDYLKNIYDIHDPSSEVEEQRSVNTEQSELSLTSIERRHLSDKLQDLQDKKVYMDQLLTDLHNLRHQQHPHLNNEMDSQSMTSSQGHIMDSVIATSSASRTAAEAQDVLDLLESRKKQKKLQDVRGRLNQLRDLVKYYQTGTDFIHGDDDNAGATAAMPAMMPDPLHNHNILEPSKKAQVTQKLRQYADSGRSESFDQQSDAASTQGDTTDTESHVSSSARAWGDDPEIQNKVRKLNAAKDKLRQLQELVSMVAQSPDIAHALPDDLAELAYSIGGDTTSQVSHASTQPVRQPDAQGIHTEGEVPPDPSEVYYESQMREQREELEQLMEERCKLLTIQEQLQKLHDQLGTDEGGGADSGRQEESTKDAACGGDGDESDTNNTRVKTVQEATQVTFQEPPEVVQSYDELYGRMRQQRMLREELREKKKELEIMMSKDRPKKQYSRNQDNQSDNVSFSNKSDPFGSKSEDYTMATWGGSTVDNLESIEEDEDGSGAGQGPHEGEDEDDDGYPSDGIVQVEEEEEAQDSDDHDTYTIEEEFGSRGSHSRRQPSVLQHQQLPASDSRDGRGQRHRPCRGAPLMEQLDEESRHYEYNFWAPDKNKVLNNVRSRRRSSRSKREQKSANKLEHEVRSLRQQFADLRTQMIAGQATSPGPLTESAFPHATSPNPIMMAHMQQQLVMNLSQSYQQLCLNQHDSADRLRRLENRLLQTESADDIVNVARREHLGLGIGAMPSSASFTHSPLLPNPFRVPNSGDVPAGSFSQRLAAGSSAVEADSYLQQYRAARAQASAPSTSDAQFRLDPRPFNFESNSAAFLGSPTSYGGAREFSENNLQADYAAIQNQVIQGDDALSEMSAAPSDLPAILAGARANQKNNSNQHQAQSDALAAALHHRSPRAQSSLARHTDLLSASEYSPMATARTTASDNIQIDTILAKDRGKIPPLDLDHILRNRSKLVKHANREVASEVSTITSSRSDAVVGRKFPIPSRANAASRLASRQLGPGGNRPGLSAGISGTAFMDASSMASLSSAVSSVPGGGSVDAVARAQLQVPQSATDSQNIEQESDATISDFTMFETLRETIYAEVATLISQNEMRPHFLIELFRELQMLSTDYLRQRSLYVIQDLVTRHLTEEETQKAQQGSKESPARPIHHWPNSVGRVLSENTPSESLITSDDEEIKAQLYARSQHGHPQVTPTQGLPQDDLDSVSGSVKSDRFDYAEVVDTTSSMSTPTSSNYWDNDHFAKDSLGDTVIHLDKALQRMREYERRMAAGEDGEDGEAPVGAVGGARSELTKAKAAHTEVASSSAQGSDTSNSDVPDDSVSSMSELSYPRIDTQQLDRQIKGIMTEVIPVLKEHMDEVCSQHLLQYIRRLVLSLTKNRDDQHEFARFFHKQLGSIVQDSLAKFEGRKMRECGEDMLVEVSEILFNELAFFRLMQDLDDPKAKVKANVKARVKQWQQEGVDSQTSTETGPIREADETTSAAESSESEGELSGADQEEGTDQQDGDDDEDEEDDQESESDYSNETDDLGRARDDELAAQMDITEKDDDSECPHKSPVKIELAVSEIKSFTRIGSDEDDEGEDEVQSADDVSETAVSRDIHNEVAANSTTENKDKDDQEIIEEVIEFEESADNSGSKIGSGEDDEGEDEVQSMDGLSETAVFQDLHNALATNNTSHHEDQDDQEIIEEIIECEESANDSAADSASGQVADSDDVAVDSGGGAVMNGEVGRFLQTYNMYLYSLPPTVDVTKFRAFSVGEQRLGEVYDAESLCTSRMETGKVLALCGADYRASDPVNTVQCGQDFTFLVRSHYTNVVLQHRGLLPRLKLQSSFNCTQVHDEDEPEDIITIDDLPTRVIATKDPSTMEEQRSAEEAENYGVAAALEVLDGAAASPGDELAGDPTALKEPDPASPMVELRHDNVLYLTAPDGSSVMTAGLYRSDESVA